MDEEEELEVLEQVEISDDEDGKSPSFLTTLPEDTVVCSHRSTDPRHLHAYTLLYEPCTNLTVF
jgi:hypothetical protein